jgi:hypothetical protein
MLPVRIHGQGVREAGTQRFADAMQNGGTLAPVRGAHEHTQAGVSGLHLPQPFRRSVGAAVDHDPDG